MDSVDRLCRLLGDEARVSGELTAVLRAQQQAIVALRPTEMLDCVERRDAIARTLLGVTAARRETASLLARACGIEGARLDDVVPRLPAGLQSRVREALGRTRGALDETRRLERQTERLVQASLAHVQDLVRSLSLQVPGARYGADAAVEAPGATAPERLSCRV